MSEKTILIVEDEAAIADSIAFALQRDGFLARHTTLGEQALAIARDTAPALVILDVGLPDISGLTARSDEIDRIVGLEIGADDYVTKPFSPRELVARVRVILRRAGSAGTAVGGDGAPGGQAARRVAGFELRAAEARILFAGQPLELTRYEYLLLKTLVEHPGHVLSRAQLMDRVWCDAPDTLDRTVDAHVKSLRAKLRAIDGNADPIQTHRGMGYSLQPGA